MLGHHVDARRLIANLMLMLKRLTSRLTRTGLRVMAMRHASPMRMANLLVPRLRAHVVIVMPAASQNAVEQRRGERQNGNQSSQHGVERNPSSTMFRDRVLARQAQTAQRITARSKPALSTRHLRPYPQSHPARRSEAARQSKPPPAKDPAGHR